MSRGRMFPEGGFNDSRAFKHITEVGRSTAFALKDLRMFWRGVIWTSPDRRQLIDVTRNHSDIADIEEMSWNKATDPAPEKFVSGLDMCAWKYIIYTEGISHGMSI